MTKRQQYRRKMRMDILTALEMLIEKGSPYGEISVADICKEAHISKPTFYRYFQNKDDITCWIFRLAIESGVAKIGLTYTWHEGFFRTALMQYRHKTLYCDKHNCKETLDFMEFSASFWRDCLTKTITEHYGLEIDGKLAFQIEALIYSEGLMAKQWSGDAMNTPPQVIAEYLTSVVPYDLYKILNTPLESDLLQQPIDNPSEMTTS